MGEGKAFPYGRAQGLGRPLLRGHPATPRERECGRGFRDGFENWERGSRRLSWRPAMNVTTSYSARPGSVGESPASAGFKVDISRGERIGRVSSEWFSRPDDERYLSLSELLAAVRARADRATARASPQQWP